MSVVTAVIIVTITGLVGAAILVAASQFMKVDVDERVSLLLEVLPGANCGACGHAGCADYAGSIVEEGEAGNLCIPGGPKVAAKIADIMGGEGGEVAEYKAVIACQGSNDKREKQYDYVGMASCFAASTLHGGDTLCVEGCLGYGDCVTACKFGAVSVSNGVAHVNAQLCTGCGACAEICPKKVIWIRPVSHKPIVMCANHQRAAQTRKSCTGGCISCGKCVKLCPTGAIYVNENVARIDIDKCIGCQECINICPVDAITAPRKGFHTGRYDGACPI